MSPSNAFEAIWPPVGDDDFDAWPEVREARKMYEAQKLQLTALARQLLVDPTTSRPHQMAQDLAILLHNIAGTAALFGQAEIGTRASALEQPVRAAFTIEALGPLCVSILAAFDPPDLD